MRRTLLRLLILLIVVAGVLGALWASNVFGWRRWRVAEVEAFIGAALPVAATDVSFATRDDPTRIIWLRFALPPDAAFNDWLTTLNLGVSLQQDWNPFPNPNPEEAAYPWWMPHSATVYDGLYGNTGDQIYELLVDRSNPANQIIYLRVYAIRS